MQVPVWDGQHPARDAFGRFVSQSQRLQWPNMTYEEARSVRFVPNRIFALTRWLLSIFGFLCILCDPAQERGIPGRHADHDSVESERRPVLPGVRGAPELLDTPRHHSLFWVASV